MPIAFAQRFPQLERVGMINDRKVWNACEAPTRALCWMKSMNRVGGGEADVPYFCFTLWIEWWAWEAGFQLPFDSTRDLEAVICQLLGRAKPPTNDMSDGT